MRRLRMHNIYGVACLAHSDIMRPTFPHGPPVHTTLLEYVGTLSFAAPITLQSARAPPPRVFESNQQQRSRVVGKKRTQTDETNKIEARISLTELLSNNT